MRLSTLELDGREQPAVLVPERGLAPFADIDPSLPDSLLTALSEGLPGGLADAAASLPDERLIPLADAVYRPLYRRPRKILGIGLNYRAHAADLSASEPTEPASFLKAEHTIIGYGDVIDLPPQSKRVTAEAELGLIFGRECRSVDQSEALQCIAGVCLILDQTAEDILQLNPRFLTRAKNFPGFFSFGPELITMDEVYVLFPSLSDIRISTVRNHKIEASATIADMVFSPSYLVSFHSRVMPFYPGDVISTGTPGAAVISDGDVVECAIKGLGMLRNSVGSGTREARSGE
jgi:2-keto-4-pentenoate hydratase/2-oxohepta-3-ene-1,7-dioic acid hydratase in catechol pathway